jgi:hypothetical protein
VLSVLLSIGISASRPAAHRVIGGLGRDRFAPAAAAGSRTPERCNAATRRACLLGHGGFVFTASIAGGLFGTPSEWGRVGRDLRVQPVYGIVSTSVRVNCWLAPPV